MKRVISFVLVAVLMLSLCGMSSVDALAEETAEVTEAATEATTEAATEPDAEENTAFVTSEECVTMIKEHEGFCKYPIWDYAQWTVGYGTRCPEEKRAQYTKYGIPEAEAEALLRSYLNAFEKEINERIIQKNNLTLTQNQFDALVSFSYNCGTAWAYKPDTALYQAVVSGADDDEILRSFALWCSAGGEVLTYLMQRRLSEANMYLNGIYDRKPPENYCYVLYNANGGTTTPRTQGYNSLSGVAPFPVPEYEGYTFVGWYTERVGGEKVTALTAEMTGTTLYAHWVDANGDSSFSKPGDVTVTVTGKDVNVRSGPGTNYTKVGKVTKGDKLVITDTVTAGGYTWGKFDKGWMALQYTNYEEAILEKPDVDQGDSTEPTEPEPTEPETTEPTEPETTEPTEPETSAPTEPAPTEPEQKPEDNAVYGIVMVEDFLRVRSGPGTGYAQVELLKPKQRVQILEQKVVGAMTWGRISNGWISMQYVELETEKPDDSGAAGTTTVGSGTIINCTQLRIRSGAGTNYALVGYLKRGDKVTFSEYKKVGSVTWGKISNGWISLDYVKLDTASDNTGSGSTTTMTGTVDVDEWLRVRAGAGTNYALVAYLKPGEKVTITETKKVGTVTWGKISSGWISMQYVKLDSGNTGSGNTGSGNTGAEDNTGSATTVLTGTVKVDEWLRIRSGPGTSYAIAGYMKPNERVEITEQKTVGAITWGKTAKGWLGMQYVVLDKDSGNTQQPAEDIRTVNATSLYIRQTPGTNGAIVGYLYNGAKVTILEIKTVSGRQWGRITNGWICLDYTK